MSQPTPVAGARFLVLLLALAWGSHWVAIAYGLRELSPWSLRFANVGLGAATLVIAVLLSGRSLAVPRGEFKHVVIAGGFNVGVFMLCSALAIVYGATSRAIIVTYSMPIWTTAMAWLVLGERFTRVRVLALLLCIAGLVTLVEPLFAAGIPLGVLFALGCALSWCFATVYVKWMKLTIDPLTNAAWQLMTGFVVVTVAMLIADGYPRLWPLSPIGIFAIIYIGVIGVGLPHFLWWAIVSKLPAVTAALGSLLVPVVGVSLSALILGDQLTANDIVGFALIFAAAACVLLQPGAKRIEMPE